ncbi:hypothetical protein [uncultured Desulfosarcina sp.]|uniref:hypothetical protein n=1 Tax=uncultured Desulfosarcina sp. TaxID=218289 RepID=UPI0029C8618F|nr:hypothetical protein [uncultured Desulfosarcina sp.]
MIKSTPSRDKRLVDRLVALEALDPNYWSFEGKADRKNGHGLFHYPAMMVPQVAEAILNVACEIHPEIERVGDPFVGSGTVLTETMNRKLNFSGIDINPLAVLLCRVKAGPFYVNSLEMKLKEMLERIDADRTTSINVDFMNIDKWFSKSNQIALSKIRRSIIVEDALWARRFFWIGLAEAARFSSNSRTSTVKLHTRPKEEIDNRTCDAIAIFRKAIERNLKYFRSQARTMHDLGTIKAGRYKGRINVTLGDTRTIKATEKNDIIITSPPYGDNLTTVTYGQYSYLPLQWIELTDIDPVADRNYLKSTHEIDSRSLGGSRRVKAADHVELLNRSPSLKSYLEYIDKEPVDRVSRVLSFFRDVDACLPSIQNSLHSGGLMVWALGNRNVGNRRVPFDNILSELLCEYGVTVLCKLNRRISSKRMAPKNSIANTMTREAILVMRKVNK